MPGTHTDTSTPNKTALVTGAGRRLGREIALALARAGWNVAVHHRQSVAEAQATARDCEALTGRPGSAQPFYAWVAGESSMIKAVRRHLVNVAGLPKPAISFQGYWKRGEAIG